MFNYRVSLRQLVVLLLSIIIVGCYLPYDNSKYEEIISYYIGKYRYSVAYDARGYPCGTDKAADAAELPEGWPKRPKHN